MSETQLIEAQAEESSRLGAKEAIAYLVEKFPACFSLSEPRPLKLGLFQELALAIEADQKVSKTLLRQALRLYTKSWRYLSACQAEAARIGLQGEEAGIVTAQEAEHAAQSLAEAKEAYQQRVEAERKAKRKEFFKQKAREENAKKRAEVKKRQADSLPKASSESLAALADKFGKK